MIDLAKTIEAKSDQLNADDLIGGAITITITKIVELGGSDQPIAIHYEGDNGKPFKPCKTVRRIFVAAWGKDGRVYVGRRVTLYRDPSVKWAGKPVGGIRISHMSHISGDLDLSLTETRGKKNPYHIKLLAGGPDINQLKQRCTETAKQGSAKLIEFWQSLSRDEQQLIEAHKNECKAMAANADEAALSAENEISADADIVAEGQKLAAQIAEFREVGDEDEINAARDKNSALIAALQEAGEIELLNKIRN